MADVRTPISPEQLETAVKIANSMAQGTHREQMIRNLIVDLVEEVRAGRDVWKLAAETYAGFRRQLLDELSGDVGAQSLMIICRACRNTPAGCNASGCGGRREVDWRGELPAGASAADAPLVPQLDEQVLMLLDPVLWTSLKGMERGEQALMGREVPPIVAELLTVLRALVDQSEIVQGRPF